MNHGHHNSETTEETLLMSPHEFAEWGVEEIAYIKAIQLNGVAAFGIFAANGEQLGLAQSFDAAIRVVIERHLELISVQ